MGEEEQKQTDPPSQPAAAPAAASAKSDSTPPFEPSRMIGIIKRKALIKEMAALYHAECLAYCQELLELQKKWEETRVQIFGQSGSATGQTSPVRSSPFLETKAPDDSRKEITRPAKRSKKTR